MRQNGGSSVSFILRAHLEHFLNRGPDAIPDPSEIAMEETSVWGGENGVTLEYDQSQWQWKRN